MATASGQSQLLAYELRNVPVEAKGSEGAKESTLATATTGEDDAVTTFDQPSNNWEETTGKGRGKAEQQLDEVSNDRGTSGAPAGYPAQTAETTQQWVLVWKKGLGCYGPYVSTISVFGWGVFLKLDEIPPELGQNAGISKYLLFNIETDDLQSLVCDGSKFPICEDVLVLPNRGALFVCKNNNNNNILEPSALVLYSAEVFARLNQQIAIPDTTKMYITVCPDVQPEQCLIVQVSWRKVAPICAS